jgi:hypothetical protein
MCPNGEYFGVFFDGTYVHYTRRFSYTLYYRRGTPLSNGTITWSAAEQTVYTGNSSIYYTLPTISVDSDGCAWVGVGQTNETNYKFLPFIFKNANNDGTWSTASNFPYQLSSTTDSAEWDVQAVSLTTQKVYAIYCRASGGGIYGQLYNGTSWGAEETDLTDGNPVQGWAFNAVNDGDDVYLTYTRAASYHIYCNKRTYGTGWAVDAILVQESAEQYTAPALSIDTATGDLYCFWMRNDTAHVYYKKCVGGEWDADPTDWIDESTDHIKYGMSIAVYYQDNGGFIGVVYVTKLASAYNVKFAYLTMEAPPLTYDFFGSATLTFTITKTIATTFSRAGTASLTFLAETMANFVSGQALSFYGSASLAFIANIFRTFDLTRHGTASLTFTAESIQNLLRTLSFGGSANLAFLTEQVRTLTFSRYGMATLTFTIETLAQGFGTWLNFFGSAPFTFNVHHWTSLVPSLEVIDYGIVALGVAVIALSLAVSTMATRKEPEKD